jgi:hypothetical protein
VLSNVLSWCRRVKGWIVGPMIAPGAVCLEKRSGHGNRAGVHRGGGLTPCNIFAAPALGATAAAFLDEASVK